MTVLHKHIIVFFVLLSANLVTYTEIVSGILQIVVLIIALFVGIRTLMLRSHQTKTEELEQKLHKMKLKGVVKESGEKDMHFEGEIETEENGNEKSESE